MAKRSEASKAAAALGRRKSPAKTAAARANGAKGGRPPTIGQRTIAAYVRADGADLWLIPLLLERWDDSGTKTLCAAPRGGWVLCPRDDRTIDPTNRASMRRNGVAWHDRAVDLFGPPPAVLAEPVGTPGRMEALWVLWDRVEGHVARQQGPRSFASWQQDVLERDRA